MFAITIATLVLSAVTQPPGVLQIDGVISSVADIRWYPWAEKPIFPHLGDPIHGEFGMTTIAPPPFEPGTSSGNVSLQVGPYLMEGRGSCGLTYCDLNTLNEPTFHNRDGLYWVSLLPDIGTGEIFVPYDGSIDPEICKWGGNCGDYPIKAQFTATRRMIGDSNLDGQFDSSDLVTVFIAGEYEDEIAGNSRFITGDWNVDREFNSADMVVAFQLGEYESSRPMIVAEPTVSIMLIMGLLMLGFFRQKTAG